MVNLSEGQRLRDFLIWLRESKGMEVCHRTFGEWRIEVDLGKLVEEYVESFGEVREDL